MTLPDLNARATLNVADFRQGVGQILADLARIADVSKRSGTIRLTAALSGTDKIKTDVDRLTSTTRRPVVIPVTLDDTGLNKPKQALSEIDATLLRLGQTVRATRNLWQTQTLTDDQAAASSARLRDELIRLAAAQELNGAQTLKATQLAAQAQRTLDASQGQLTKGGFAFSASLGILDALSNLGGPIGSAAGLLGKYVGDGLGAGLKGARPQVGKASSELGDDVIAAIQTKLQIHSPSLVMVDVGKFIGAGLILGIKSNTADVVKASADLVAGVPAAVQGAFNDPAKLNAGGAFAGSFLGGFKTALDDLPKVLQTVASETGEATKKLADDVSANVAPPFEGLGETFGKLSEKLREVPEAAAEASAGTADAGDAAAEAGNGVEALAGFLGAAAAGAGIFASALAVAVPKAAEFQAAIANIGTESDLSQAQLDQLGAGVLAMAGRVGQSAQLLAQASYDVVGAGVKGADSVAKLNALTEISARAASAGLTDTSTAVNVITGALNAYGLSADNAQHVSDVLFKTTSVGKISFEQIGKSMGVLFPLANTLGVNLESLSAGVATLTQVGIPAEQAVTGLQNVFSNVLKPSSEATKLAKELGIQFDATALKSKGLAGFLGSVQAATHGNVEQMGTLFGSTEAVNSVFALTSTQGAARLKGALDDLQGSAGATDDAFAKQAGTFKFAQAQYSAASEAFQIQFGLKFLPVLTSVTKGLAGFTSNLDTLGQNGVVQFALIVGGGTAAVGTILKLSAALKEAALSQAILTGSTNAGGFLAFGRAVLGTTASVQLFTASTTVAGAAMSPLLPVALAIGAAFAGWKLGEMIGNLKLFGDETTTVNDKLQDFFATTLFGADPQLIKEMRDQEEAQQRAQLNKKDSTDDATAAVLRQADAERKAAEAQAKVDATRSAALQTIKDQKTALDDLSKSLGDRSLAVKLDGQSQVRQDLAKIGADFDALRLKVKAAFSGDVTNPKLVAALRSITVQQAAEEAATRSKYAEQAVTGARDAATAARRAEVDAMREGAPRIAAQRALELDELRADIRKRADAARDFPAQREAIEVAGQRQIEARRRGFAQADEQAAREAAARLATAYQGVADAQATAAVSASAARVAELSLQTDRRVAAARGDAVKVAQAEAEGGRLVAQEQQRAADEQYRSNVVRLQNTATVALSSDRLTAGERTAIAAKLAADLGDLDSRYVSDSLARARTREQAERDAAEKIRAARVASAFVPVEQASTRLSDLAADAALLKTDEQRLANEREQQTVRLDALRLQDLAIAQARRQGATAAELTKATADRRNLARDVLKGEQAIVDVQERQRQTVVGLFEAVRTLARLQGDTGASAVVSAQRDVERATGAVGEAYRKAAPYLAAFSRSSSLSVADHAAARDAVTGLTGALQAERAALDTLRGKWDEQRVAVASVRDTVAQLDTLSGGSAALRRRVTETTSAYVEAQRLLSQGSGADPAQLAKLAGDFQSAYSKRLAAERDYSEAVAKGFDEQATAEKSAADRQAKTDQGRLDALKAQLDVRRSLDALTGQPVGAEAALASSTREVASAYRETLPLLQSYALGLARSPAQLAALQTASGRLVAALSDQQAKLEGLRAEYGKQRDALSGLQGILGGFGKDLGSKPLIEQALAFNQQTYDRAKRALADLLDAGTPDPVKLQAAATSLRSAYGDLKGSLDDLGRGSQLGKIAADLPNLLQRTGDAAQKAGTDVDALGARLTQAEREAIATGQGLDAQTVQRIKAQLAPERELERQRADLQAQVDARAAASTARLDALAASAKGARDAGQAAIDELNRSAQATVGSLSTAAQVAQRTTDSTGASLRAAELAYTGQLRQLSGLSESFVRTLQQTMSDGGFESGRALANGLAAGYAANMKPLASVSAGALAGAGIGRQAGAGSTTNVNLYVDGKQAASVPTNLRRLLYDLRDQTADEIRKGNL